MFIYYRMTLFCDKLILNSFLNKVKIISNVQDIIPNRKYKIKPCPSFNPTTLTDISKNVKHSEYNAIDYLFLKHRISIMTSIDENSDKGSNE